jgi:hypothetical protein
MCLENKIVSLTEAIQALTVALTGGSTAAPEGVKKTQTKKPAATEPVATTPAATEPVATTPAATEPVATTPAATEPVATTPAATTPAATEPSYEDDVKPALVTLADALRSRDKLVGFLSQFGVNSARNLKPEQYATVLAAVKTELKLLQQEA